MKKYSLMIIAGCLVLSGCLHHKSKKSKVIKSQERQVRPEIKQYHENKNSVPTPQEVVNTPPEPPKEEPVVIIPPKEEPKKNPSSSWWSWDD